MMRQPRLRATTLRWRRLPGRSARLRLTALYSGLFLVLGAVLLALAYTLFWRALHLGGGHTVLSVRNGINYPAAQLPRLQAATEAQQKAWDLNEFMIQSGIAFAVVAVLAIVLGWLSAGRVLRPLSTITAAARRISASSLNERLNLPGPDDELKALGDTLDDLLDRLAASFEAQRHFVANASHELRTPLTADRTLLQVALDDPATPDAWRFTGEELLASNAEQERLIEALLTLASSEGGLDHREPVDLAAVANEALLAPRPEADRLALRVEATTKPAVLHGDRVLAERLVANLVGNAVSHNVPGGFVQVDTGTSRGHAVLSVVNTGPVIPPDEVERLFQPFQRLHSRRTADGDGHGYGLGLSIVRAIAAAHDATITARALPGGGLAVDVAFPPSPAEFA
jgi:signal transduction histidine kinase